MNIVQRNFFRLIRSGVFQMSEQVEPMSAYKWGQLQQLAIMHDVVQPVYSGIERCKGQFFFQLTEQQWNQWEKAIKEAKDNQETYETDKFLKADHLTNPFLNRRLQAILDDENSDTRTRQMLLLIIRVARHILNEGVPVRQLIALGVFLRSDASRVDFTTLEKWLRQLRLYRIAQLECTLLMNLFGFETHEMPLWNGKQNKDVERVAQELTEFTNTRAQDFYFSQDSGNIFVHTSNGAAMLGHIRRSARYFHYFPSETLTNFFASFAHSLSHIEE